MWQSTWRHDCRNGHSMRVRVATDRHPLLVYPPEAWSPCCGKWSILESWLGPGRSSVTDTGRVKRARKAQKGQMELF